MKYFVCQNLDSSQTWTTSSLNTANQKKVGWHELINLEQLYRCKMISENEYTQRKNMLVDLITGTKINDSSKFHINNQTISKQENRSYLFIYLFLELRAQRNIRVFLCFFVFLFFVVSFLFCFILMV